MIEMEKITMNSIAEQLSEQICKLQKKSKEKVVIAIDGKCGSGKTTLAKMLQEKILCNVIHMDDFFLRPEQRTEERYRTPGGNLDYERFVSTIVPQLRDWNDISYVPFDCRTMTMGKPIVQVRQSVVIVEGTYSCHPSLFYLYDYHCFLQINEGEQRKRIQKRNGNERLRQFEDKWIPMENEYFQTFSVEENCEMTIDTTNICE